MRIRLSVACGVVFALATMVAAGGTIANAPRHALATLRGRMTTCALPGLQCAPPGVFLHQRSADIAPDAAFGPPDPDTLLSSAWVRLADGPALLRVPPTAGRNFTVQVIDARDRTVAVLGPDRFGPDGGTLALVAAGTAAPDANALVLAGEWAWVIVRIAVPDGDATAASEWQNALAISRPRAAGSPS